MVVLVKKMLEYEKVDISEGSDISKTVASKNLCFVIIGISKILDLNFNQMFVINVIMY